MCIAPVTINAARRPTRVDPLRMDPSRTTTLRAAFLAEVNRRFERLKRAIRRVIDDEDAFGLRDYDSTISRLESGLTVNAKWKFETDSGKVKQFNGWLQGQIDAGILIQDTGLGEEAVGDAWTGKYVKSAYKKGVVSSYVATHKDQLAGTDPKFYQGGQSEFLRSAFESSEAVSKIQLIATRSYEGLKGVTASMSTTMSRTLSQGLADGKNPNEIAKTLTKAVDDIGIVRARTLARTEVMHAHAEGQLDGFTELEVEGVGIMAEWSTAGDGRVCSLCYPLEGVVMTIKQARGKIPRHPNCRCTWIPANVGEEGHTKVKQIKDAAKVQEAIEESARIETKKGNVVLPVEEALAKSKWAGANKVVAEDFAETSKKASFIADQKAVASASGISAKTVQPDGKLAPRAWDFLLEKKGLLGKVDDVDYATWEALPDVSAQVAWMEAKALAVKEAAEAAAKAAIEQALAAKKALHVQKTKEGIAKAKAKKLAEKQAAEAAAQIAEQQAAKEALAAKLKAQVPEGMPNPAEVKIIKDLPGSTKPKLVEDAAGKQWVMKADLKPEHVRSEALADKLYRIAGLDTPASGIVETSEGPIKFSEFLDGGQTLAQWKAGKSAAEVQAMYDQLKDGFVADALLGNYDVAGLTFDNILVVNGKAIRIDNGGALTFRAQGLKKANFGATVGELDSLRDAKINSVTAEIFKGIDDAAIDKQIKALLDKRADLLGAIEDASLRDTIAKRLDYLEGRLPKAATRPRAVVKGPKTAEYGIGPETADRVRESRINGTTLAGDSGDIEDMNVLVWQEETAAGSQVTRLHLKTTIQGSRKIEVALGDELNRAQASGVMSNVHPLDNFYDKIIAGAKTVSTHASDGKYNFATLIEMEKAKQSLQVLMTNKDAQTKAMVKHYLELIQGIDEARAANKASPTVARYVWKPPKAKEVERGPWRVSSGGLEFETKEVRNARAKVVSGPKNTFTGYSGEAKMYTIDAGDGVEIKFIPQAQDFGDSQTGLAFKGTVQIGIEGEVTNDSIQRGLSTLKALGIDASPPTPDYEELVYLHRSIYMRNDATKGSYRAIWEDSTLTDGEKVKKIKGWVQKNYGLDVDTLGEAYNPRGYAKTSWGDGSRYWKRWDLPEDEVAVEMKNYRVVHTSGGLGEGTFESTKAALEGILQTGGEFTSTAERVRKGVNVSATGGASSSADVTTGGASYFFTRIKKQDSLPKRAFVFKPTVLARQDAISYSSDQFGRISALNERGATVEKFREFAAKSSNETIFKNSLSLDDLDAIRVGSEAERKELLTIFKANKLDKLPDGRKVEDVVTVSK